MSKGFYLTSCHNWVGSNVSFHAINGKGYTTNIDEAHIYTKEEMQKHLDNGDFRTYPNEEMPLCVSRVNAVSTWHVDFQYVKEFWPENKDQNDEYVIYKKNTWDGNDLGFAATLSHNFDYSKARVFTESELAMIDLEGWVAVPKSHTDEIARRTIQDRNINKRKMITSAGLKGYRKKRESKSSGKERWNCPCCGKISWQYHPYEFEGCNDVNCDEWTASYERISPYDFQ